MESVDEPTERQEPAESGVSAAGSGAKAEGRPGPAPSGVVEDYLKAVYKLQPAGGTVSTSDLADELERSAAAVTSMVKSLAERGQLEHVPYHGVQLTREGEKSALRIIRRHRVIELYLIEKLGYTWDNVHEQAELLEHAASDELVDRMAASLGDPTVDPHGAPIPTSDGEMSERTGVPLSRLESGAAGIVRQVADEDSERLRYLAGLGLFPGTEVSVRRRAPFDGPLTVEVGDETHAVDRELAENIVVEEL